MQLTLDGRPLDDLAIETIRTFAPKNGKPYQLQYSGGKDSTVILDLTKRSGIPFEATYRFVPIDPPELRKFIYQQKLDPSNRISVTMPKRNLITIARERGMMPLRTKRWCCEVLKESQNAGDVLLTGIRRAESGKRKARRMVEACTKVDAWFVHPILDWKTSHVWDYIHERNLPYCSLYDEGWKRLGCILCPMNREVEKQILRWPGVARVWKKINDAVWHTRHTRHFDTPEKQWEWWLDRDRSANPDDDCPLFDGILE